MSYLIPFAHSVALEANGEGTTSDEYLDLAHLQLQALLADLTEEDRAVALMSVRTHRDVHQTWLSRRPRTQVVRLAASAAPSGRTLGPDDYIDIEWTVHDPTDDLIADRITRRRTRLLRLMAEAAEKGAAPTVADLAAATESSSATVRRDLSALRNAGEQIATRGERSRDDRSVR
jgi:hypothetical protein